MSLPENPIPPDPSSVPSDGIPSLELPPLVARPSRFAGMFCVQHPAVAATQQCHSCGAYLCGTCDFLLPGDIHLCPPCATKPPSTELSPGRKKAMFGSFALAIWCTIELSLLMGGFFASYVTTKAGEDAFGVFLTLTLLIPSIVGFAWSLGAIDRRLSNPAPLWAAMIWNAIILVSFLLLCIIGLMQ